MTTETVRDPVIEAWSDNLEEGLVDAGMDEASARAYRQAFELGLTRVISQTATRQELHDGLAQVRAEIQESSAQGRQELHEGLAQVRAEMQESAAQGRRELRESAAQSRQELHDGLAQVRAEMGELRREMERLGDRLRAEMKEIQAQLQREMDQRFGEMQKRLNLLTWVVGVGFAGMFGLMSAILAAILTRL